MHHPPQQRRGHERQHRESNPDPHHQPEQVRVLGAGIGHVQRRAFRDLDRRELAELTGSSEAQIVSWERGRARLYPIELIKLCHALDVMPEWLLCWERRLH